MSDDIAPGQVEQLLTAVTQLQLSVQALQKKVDGLDKKVVQAGANSAAAKPVAPKVVKKVGPGVLVAGVRGHGKIQLENYLAMGGCYIAYICDVDQAVGKAAADMVEEKAGYRPNVVRDIRQALPDPQLEIVSIATPHHWHALMAIWALRAGKHVYIEKPLSQTYDEGLSVLAAAEKYGKVVQFGTQLRSNTSMRAAAEFIQSGAIGDVQVVHCIVYRPRPAVPATNENVIPKTVDYDLWCGPGRLAPVKRSKFHYHWHWTWDFGNGALGNNGVHRVDVARIGMGPLLPGLGDAVLSFGGRFGELDFGETPNTQVAVHRFGERWIIQEVRGLPTEPHLGVSNGIIFYGGNGWNVIYEAGSARLVDAEGRLMRVFEGKQENHYRNFLNAVKANDPSAVAGDVREGFLSSALGHLGNISYRLGRPASDEEIAAALRRLQAPDMVVNMLQSIRAHLEVNDAKGDMTLGGTLLLTDDLDHPIGNHPDAEALLTRPIREPFVVPTPGEV